MWAVCCGNWRAVKRFNHGLTQIKTNMKTLKFGVAMICAWVLATAPAGAVLTVQVTPGYAFGPDETPTTDHLNALGQPTVEVTGTLDGSTSLAAGSVNGILLADSVPDGISIQYNAAVPRNLQVLSAGVASWGLTNDSTTTLRIAFNSSLAWDSRTNVSGGTNVLLSVSTNWVYQTIWKPAQIWNIPTNGFYTNSAGNYTNPANAWGYTNIAAITNLIQPGVGGLPILTPTVTSNDIVPLIAFNQGGSNTTMTLGTFEKWVQSIHPKQIATLYFSGTTNGLCNSNDVVTSMTVQDGNGLYTLMSFNNAVTVSNNLTLTNLAQRVAAAINSTASNPQFSATASGTNILVYEPLLNYPQAGCAVAVNFATTTNLNVWGVSAVAPPLIANIIPYQWSTNFTTSSPTITSTNITAVLSGGVPPYTLTWSSTILTNNGGTETSATFSTNSWGTSTFVFTNTTTFKVNLSGYATILNNYVTNQVKCTVTDASGQGVQPVAPFSFIRQ